MYSSASGFSLLDVMFMKLIYMDTYNSGPLTVL